MDIIRIEGCTRTIGESQGYIGLPLRDVTINDAVDGPGAAAMESAWAFSDEEIYEIAAGKPVILRVMGTVHPPVMLYVGDQPHPIFTDAARDVLVERARQIDKEGFDAAHDDAHNDGAIARAAACYASFAGLRDRERVEQEYAPGSVFTAWPWDPSWWKPTDRRADLVKAAALILADIDRLDRAKVA